jgi:Major Facilitator Superfamily
MSPPAATPPARPPGVEARAAGWRWRAFRRLLETQAAHAAGDVLVAVALANTVFFSVPLGEARARVALYLALTMAPFAVLSPLVGPWLDRRAGSYRVAIVAAMVGRVVLAVLLSSRSQHLALYPLAFGLLVLSRVHGVSRSALVPEARPPGRSLMWANARVAVVSVAAGAAGAGPAVALNHWVGTGATLWAAAVVYAAGALAATGLPLGEGEERPRERVRRYQELLTPRLLAGGVAMAALRAAVGFVTFLLAFLLRAEGEGGKGLAIAAAAAAAGGFAGSVSAPALRAVLREPLLLLASLALTAAVAVWAALGFGLLRAGVLAAGVSFGAGGGRLAFDSLLQRDAPDHVRARTFARYETIFQLCWVAGAAVATAVPFGPAAGLGALAWLCLGGLALSAWGLLHSAGRAPAPPRLALADRLRALPGQWRRARAVSERSSRRPW